MRQNSPAGETQPEVWQRRGNQDRAEIEVDVLLARRFPLEMVPVAAVAVVPGSKGNVLLARRFPLEIMPVAAGAVVPAYCTCGELDAHLDSACNILVAIDRAPQEG